MTLLNYLKQGKIVFSNDVKLLKTVILIFFRTQRSHHNMISNNVTFVEVGNNTCETSWVQSEQFCVQADIPVDEIF